MTELIKAERPEVVNGSTVKTMTGCGSLYVTPGIVEGELFEVFAKLGKAGGCAAAQNEAICRLISLVLRYGIQPKQIVKQLKGISCHQSGGGGCAKSCADGIARTIEREISSLAEVQPKQLDCVEKEGEDAELAES